MALSVHDLELAQHLGVEPALGPLTPTLTLTLTLTPSHPHPHPRQIVDLLNDRDRLKEEREKVSAPSC